MKISLSSVTIKFWLQISVHHGMPRHLHRKKGCLMLHAEVRATGVQYTEIDNSLTLWTFSIKWIPLNTMHEIKTPPRLYTFECMTAIDIRPSPSASSICFISIPIIHQISAHPCIPRSAFPVTTHKMDLSRLPMLSSGRRDSRSFAGILVHPYWNAQFDRSFSNIWLSNNIRNPVNDSAVVCPSQEATVELLEHPTSFRIWGWLWKGNKKYIISRWEEAVGAMDRALPTKRGVERDWNIDRYEIPNPLRIYRMSDR